MSQIASCTPIPWHTNVTGNDARYSVYKKGRGRTLLLSSQPNPTHLILVGTVSTSVSFSLLFYCVCENNCMVSHINLSFFTMLHWANSLARLWQNDWAICKPSGLCWAVWDHDLAGGWDCEPETAFCRTDNSLKSFTVLNAAIPVPGCDVQCE